MNMRSIPQLKVNWKPEGESKRKRPRKSWKDKLMRDMVENRIDEEDTEDKKRAEAEGCFCLKGNLSNE